MIKRPSKKMKYGFIVLTISAIFIISGCTNGSEKEKLPASYQNYDKEIDELLGKMTLVEKVIQLSSSFPTANTRLGIPQLAVGEALHGLWVDGATQFPQAIGLGATWEPELIEKMGEVIGKEGRAVGVHQVYSPTLSLARDARWGRNEETYGEDAHLAARMGVAYIKGVQGMGEERYGPDKMMCTMKHYVGEGNTLRGGNGMPIEISEPTFRETDLVPFEAAVKEAHVGAVMGASNSVNRIPIHANKWLLTDILRNEWGFDGFVMSDNVDIVKIHRLNDNEGHYFASSPQEAARMALEAGVDAELAMKFEFDADNRTFGGGLVRSVEEGKIPMELIDRAVRNVLRAKFRLGLFNSEPVLESCDFLKGADLGETETEGADHWATAIKKGASLRVFKTPRDNWKEVFATKEHEKLALKIAQKSIVLLKNENNLLPLDKSKINSIAVLGPNASDKIRGCYSNNPRYWISILDGIRNYVGKDVKVGYARGCYLNPSDRDNIPEAVNLAKKSDLSIIVVGTSGRTMCENKDRAVIELTGRQEELVKAVHAIGKPVIVILSNGGQLAIPWLKDNIPAIVEGWYGGQETGTAMAQVLFGDVNPGGKLPVTFPSHTGMVPCYYNGMNYGGPNKYNEGKYSICYPFGFGLSYTTFDISKPHLDKAEISKDASATLTVKVTNTGDREGDEVVQVYVIRKFASLVRPFKELKAFKRVTIAPGETQEVTFNIGFEQLKSWFNGKWDVESGEFILRVGNDSESGQDISLKVN